MSEFDESPKPGPNVWSTTSAMSAPISPPDLQIGQTMAGPAAAPENLPRTPAADAAAAECMGFLADAPSVRPTIGVSQRPGQGYDMSRFQEQKHAQYELMLDPDLVPPRLGKNPSDAERAAHQVYMDRLAAAREAVLSREEGEEGSVSARMRERMAGIHGLFLPGDGNRNMNQIHSPSAPEADREGDRGMNEPDDPTEIQERATRDPFEQMAVRHARNTGMPVMAVCAGSWRLLSAYGGCPETIPADERLRHQDRLSEPAHSLLVHADTHLNAALGRGVRCGWVRGANSTHWAAAARDPEQPNQLLQRPDAPNEPHDPIAHQELQISAMDWVGRGVPEAIESRHGAPIVGIQSHPEYFLPKNYDPEKNRSQFAQFSRRLFDNFEGAARTYARRQLVNQEIRDGLPNLRHLDGSQENHQVQRQAGSQQDHQEEKHDGS